MEDEGIVSLETLGGGAAVERFNDELEKVLNNILDPDTKPTATREVVLKVTIKPAEDRGFSGAEIHCNSKLAPSRPVGTRFYIGRQNGKAIAREHDPRQLSLTDEKEGDNPGLRAVK